MAGSAGLGNVLARQPSPLDQSAVSLSESHLARSPQPTCASSTREVFVKMLVSRPRLSRTESPFLGPGPGICCFLQLPERPCPGRKPTGTVSALSLRKLLGTGEFFRRVGGLAWRQAHGLLSQTWVQMLALTLTSCVILVEPP